MTLPATWRWRLSQVWKALSATTMPDPQAFEKWKAERDQAFALSLQSLPEGARHLLLQPGAFADENIEILMNEIEKLFIECQISILRHMISRRPDLVVHPRLQRWARRNSSLLARPMVRT